MTIHHLILTANVRTPHFSELRWCKGRRDSSLVRKLEVLLAEERPNLEADEVGHPRVLDRREGQGRLPEARREQGRRKHRVHTRPDVHARGGDQGYVVPPKISLGRPLGQKSPARDRHRHAVEEFASLQRRAVQLKHVASWTQKHLPGDGHDGESYAFSMSLLPVGSRWTPLQFDGRSGGADHQHAVPFAYLDRLIVDVHPG